jgi:preprotein translocase subunit SecF
VSSENGLASRLYRGDADLNIVGRRRLWFVVAGIATLIAVLGISVLRFDLGIEFAGGNEFQLPARVGTVAEAQEAVTEAIAALPDSADAEVATSQRVGNAETGTLMVRTSELSPADSTAVKTALGERFGLRAD